MLTKLIACSAFVGSVVLMLTGQPRSIKSSDSLEADYESIEEKTPSNATSPSLVLRRGKYYRDNYGRVREEKWTVTPKGERQKTTISITDPTAGTQYRLDPDTLIATRFIMRRTTAGPKVNPVPPVAPPSVLESPFLPPKVEELGTRVIEGFTARGQKVCRKEGTCNEVWQDANSRIVFTIRESAPGRSHVSRWHNFRRNAQLDPSLFEVPTNFTIVEQSRRSVPNATCASCSVAGKLKSRI